MRTLPRLNARAFVLASAAAAVLIVAGAISGATGDDGGARAEAEAWRSAFEARPQVDLGGRMIVVLAAPSLADRMANAKRPLSPAAQRRAVKQADAFQRRLVAALRVQGVRIQRLRSYTRTFNGFSAVLDARAIAALDRAPGVVGVYPVRAVYAASLSSDAVERPEFAPNAGRRPDVSVPGADGAGVTVAVLDTGVDRDHPALSGRALPGVDLVASDGDASPGASPADPAQLERHGTMMAAIVAGDELGGVAPSATILPIRVLGWQRTATGAYKVVGRSDVLLAGIERAVDPNANGDVRDAAEVALAALVEPYAGFADGPEARAVAGASSLGTLVVAAAGNDGPAGGRLGTIGAPGGTPAALTVGAVDLRDDVLTAGVSVSIDGQQVYEGASRVLGATPLAEAATVSGDELVVIPADGSPIEPRARAAFARGAAAVLIYGSGLPAGSLDLNEDLAAPVVTLPLEVGRTIDEARERGATVSVVLEQLSPVANPAAGRVAPFSSRGPAFGGNPKPELVAPGVGIVTADAGGASDPRYATVTGSSAAAAVVAGAAALVADARPGLDARQLAAVLVGSARSLEPAGDAEPVSAQGAGVVDPAAAAAADLAIEPVGIVLVRSEGKGVRFEQTVRVTNLSNRPLRAHVTLEESGDGSALVFGVEPGTLRLGPGKSADVAVTASARRGSPTPATLAGVLVVSADGAAPARAPWAAALPGRGSGPLVEVVGLSERAFRPAKRPASVLSFRAGQVRSSQDGLELEPVGVLEVELWAKGRRLGVLARYRDLLPGRFELGLTGRGPAGEPLPPGRYELRLRARPADAREGNLGPASVASVSFAIRR